MRLKKTFVPGLCCTASLTLFRATRWRSYIAYSSWYHSYRRLQYAEYTKWRGYVKIVASLPSQCKQDRPLGDVHCSCIWVLRWNILRYRVISLIYLWLWFGSEAKAAIIPWNRRNSSTPFRWLKRKERRKPAKSRSPDFQPSRFFRSSN